MPPNRRNRESCFNAEETGLALAIEEGLKTKPVERRQVLNVLGSPHEGGPNQLRDHPYYHIQQI